MHQLPISEQIPSTTGYQIPGKVSKCFCPLYFGIKVIRENKAQSALDAHSALQLQECALLPHSSCVPEVAEAGQLAYAEPSLAG